jgi:hypothetical protein
MNEPIRIFVGCAPNHDDAESQAVLEWSIRKHASRPVDITWMMLSRDQTSPFAGWHTAEWATPFSGFRWAVPKLCEFQGRAIYTDSDVIFMADVAELFDQAMHAGACVLGRHDARLCVSLWDCARARLWLPPIAHMKRASHSESMLYDIFRYGEMRGIFDGAWNDLDVLTPDTKALHYTEMSTQPQLEYALPRLAAKGMKHWYDGPVQTHPSADIRRLFTELLDEATSNGYGVERYTQHEPYGDIPKRSFAGRTLTVLR